MAFLEKSHPLRQTLASIVKDEGFVLYDAELLTPGSLRLSISKPKVEKSDTAGESAAADETGAKEGGVTSRDCSRVLRRLMVLFQAEGRQLGVSTEPEIDVSSPGLDRLLRLPEHYELALGERVKLILLREFERSDGKKSVMIVGRLEKFSEGKVSVLDESEKKSLEVPLSDVKRANVEYVFS